MAFTATEQQDIIYYLGWPGKTLVTGSTHFNSVIADRLTNLNAPIENQARALLVRIKKVDSILSGPALDRASTKELGDIKLDDTEMHRLRRERRIVINEISDLLDIDVNKRGGVSISVSA